jgi:hypothetical protein
MPPAHEPEWLTRKKAVGKDDVPYMVIETGGTP